VTKEVDPKYEISAIVKKLDLMEKIQWYFFEKGELGATTSLSSAIPIPR